jgi:NADH-quinone oxidoreductase subunit N
MLYGISLLVGTLGSAHFPTMSDQLAQVLGGSMGDQRAIVLMLAGLMLGVGVAFKLSAVPFHFWAPDVFEGAPAEVGAFLSIASKAAALGLLVRISLAFSSAAPACEYIVLLLAAMAAVTCTFGNLAAYGQTNIKRLLAYSTIAHAGYMLMPVVAAVALIDAGNPAGARTAIAALAFYISVYVFMNLGAFASVAFLRNTLGSEEIADYGGLIRRSPGMAVCLSIVMFSLLGMPPLAGFAAKFTIFAELFYAFDQLSNWLLLMLLVIAGLNTVLSLYYYLRVVKVMILSPVPDGQPEGRISVSFNAGLLCMVVAMVLVLVGICWDRSFSLADAAAAKMLMY